MKYLKTILFLIVYSINFAQLNKCGEFEFLEKSNLDSASHAEFCNFLTNDVKVIKLASIRPTCYTEKYKDERGGVHKERMCSYESVIKKNNINTRLIQSEVEVLPSDFNKILYHLYHPVSGRTFEALCYEPRHGIVFYNHKNKVVGSIEICFSCHQMRTTERMPETGSIALKDYKEIKLVFKKYLDNNLD